MSDPHLPTAKIDKAELRQKLRVKRRQLPDHLRASHNKSIRYHVSQLAQSRGIESIGCYWPFDGEPDTTLLCKQWIAGGIDVALPIISAHNDHTMEFHRWEQGTLLKRNKYGICEPMETEKVPLTSVDMLLMPLVAYDCNGSRIGMGSGYYDRCLENFRDLTAPLRVGIAYSFQEIDPFNKNGWDISLHGVVNERGWFTFST